MPTLCYNPPILKSAPEGKSTVSEIAVKPRLEIPAEYTWNAPSVFESDTAWEAEFKSLAESLTSAGQYNGRLAEGAAVLLEALQAIEQVVRRVSKLYAYTTMAHNVETTNQTAAKMFGRAQGLFGRVLGTISFLDPELIAMGQEKLLQWLKDEPRLAIYAHYVDDLFRKQAHVRSAEVEELLGMLADPFSGPSMLNNILTNADFKFRSGHAQDGSEIEVTQGALDNYLSGKDREARRTAWESYTDTYLAYKNTLATNLANSIKQNVFSMRARRHPSTLAASLFDNNVPVEVFHNLIATYKKNLPTWHRYWAVRRKALGVDTLHPYDIWAPIASKPPQVTYQQAVDWICKGLEPLGEDYVRTLRQGCLQDRWVDVYPNQGKTDGAFSSGAPGTHPFILMSFDDTLFSMSTLAHELGHSLHSHLTWQTQPLFYSNYSLFIAEVASNFNQAMTRAYLLDHNSDPDFQIAVIEEAMANFHRYFFIMPTLARFELELHERLERGEGATADDMISLMADLFAEGYGGEMHVDRERVGITWATFGHLYADYYVYQYATGISAANALSRRILSGTPNAAQDYVKFLTLGSSVYPLEALKVAGVDMTTPQAVEEAFAVLGGMVERLEKLFSK
jgi:oligoendopeptidase F